MSTRLTDVDNIQCRAEYPLTKTVLGAGVGPGAGAAGPEGAAGVL